MNIALCYNDINRFWTVGSYIQKELTKYDSINIVTHCRIPEDTGILEAQCNLDLDFVLVIDDGHSHFKLHHHTNNFLDKVKTAIWLSDLHRPDWAQWRLQIIREWHYNHVFYAQKNFKEMVMNQGYSESECSWLPHAADPDIFSPMNPIHERYDIGYVGFLNDKRIQAAEVLNQFNFKHFNSVWAWMANRCLNECKIGFNMSVEDDINMRCFETMAAGLPLITNEINDNGMEELFTNDEILTYLSMKDLKEKVEYLLSDETLQQKLSKNGRRKVLEKHTYRHRLETILTTLGFQCQ